ncbi:hypothetical protein JL720_13960 [Aureococcus anophagefferens]|nr:hypothetical protein JL720_13960 [Aureococcus anophagefferens]
MTCHEHWSRWARYDFFRPNDARPTLTDEATAKGRRSADGVTAGAACCMFGGGRTVWVRDGPPLRKPELGSERLLPLSCVDHVATKFPSIDELVRSGKGSNLGSDGGKWSACTHLAVYGFNFATFFARHLAYGLRPRSVLEFGCGIGTTADFRAARAGREPLSAEPSPCSRTSSRIRRAGALRPVQLAMDAFDASAAPCVRDLFGGATTFDLVLAGAARPHAETVLEENAEPNAQKRRAWLEGMWMALWPKLDLTIRRLKLGRGASPASAA